MSRDMIQVIDMLDCIKIVDGKYVYYVNSLPGVAIHRVDSPSIYKEYTEVEGSSIKRIIRRGMSYVLTGIVSKDTGIIWDEMTRAYYVIDLHLEGGQIMTYLFEPVAENEYNGDGPLTEYIASTFNQCRYTLYGDGDNMIMIFTEQYSAKPGEIVTYVQAKDVLDKELYDVLY